MHSHGFLGSYPCWAVTPEILLFPIQMMSINSATTLTVSKITMNNANGASLGHNTDAFDVGSFTGVTTLVPTCEFAKTGSGHQMKAFLVTPTALSGVMSDHAPLTSVCLPSTNWRLNSIQVYFELKGGV